jgi:hypothetical protein
MANRALVLDANILIRAVFGKQVRHILEKYADGVSFFVPDYAYVEAEEHPPSLIIKRGGDPAKGLTMLRAVVAIADLVRMDLYGDYEAEASQAKRYSRSRRLADFGISTRPRLPNLDRGSGLVWVRSGNVDIQ